MLETVSSMKIEKMNGKNFIPSLPAFAVMVLAMNS